MTDNPYEPVSVEKPSQTNQSNQSPNNAAYNIVTDTIIGANIRKSDNVFQAIFVGVSLVVGLVLGAIFALLFGGKDFPWMAGAVVGAFLGMVLGLFASGIYLGIYRASRHIKGKHD